MALRWVTLSLALAASAQAADGKAKLVVLSLTAPKELPASTRGALDDAIAHAAAQRGFFEVLSSHDVEVLLGLERQKALLGCSEDSCLAELSGALGARFVLSGTLGRVGESWQLSLQTQDTQKAVTIGRATRIARDVESLHALLPWLVSEATATPLPPAPSRFWPITLISAGSLFAIAGAYVGVRALEDEVSTRNELARGVLVPGLLGPVAQYQDMETSIRVRKTGSIIALAVGAGLVALGIWLWKPDPSRGAAVALVPTFDGAVLVGVW